MKEGVNVCVLCLCTFQLNYYDDILITLVFLSRVVTRRRCSLVSLFCK